LKLSSLKKVESHLKDELVAERERRKRAELKNKIYKKRLQEMKAFQNTVQNFMHHSKNTYSPNLVSGN
jgi:hypothetical protein